MTVFSPGPGAVEASDQRRWPWRVTWLALVALGLLALAVSVALLVQARLRPGSLAGLAPWGVPTLVAGALALCVGANGLLLGLGMDRRFLPPGSHRAVVLTTMLALALAALVVGTYLLVDPGASANMGQTFMVGIAGLYGALALMAYLHGVRSGLISVDSLGLTPGKAAGGALWGVGGTLAILGVSTANGLLLQGLGLANPQFESFRWLEGRQPLDYVGAALGVAIVAPIVEELFFRGYVFNAYLVEKGRGTAYFGSSLVFGIAHGLPTVFLGIFGMGLVLAFIYRRAGTIVAPIVAHILNNGIALAALIATVRP